MVMVPGDAFHLRHEHGEVLVYNVLAVLRAHLGGDGLVGLFMKPLPGEPSVPVNPE